MISNVTVIICTDLPILFCGVGGIRIDPLSGTYTLFDGFHHFLHHQHISQIEKVDDKVI